MLLELDMYGDVIPAGMNNHEMFKYGIPIPVDILMNKDEMRLIRSYYRYNIDLPGNLEDVNPMKFVPNLTPIEEMRYTPVVPIDEKSIEENKKKIRERKRKDLFFEIDKKKMFFYCYCFVFSIIVYKVYTYFSYHMERFNYEVEKKRLRRYRYREDDDLY